ncbi:MAG: GxxExxY protein [Candidatus Hydrogenedentota bacterium]
MERYDQQGDQGLLLKDEVYGIVGAAIEVSKNLGNGFLEAVYQEALALELGDRGIPHEEQKPIRVRYKNHLLRKEYYADFLCYDQIIIEIKATKAITPIEEAQLLNYLRATQLPAGIILNFGSPKFEWKRFANTRKQAPRQDTQ